MPSFAENTKDGHRDAQYEHNAHGERVERVDCPLRGEAPAVGSVVSTGGFSTMVVRGGERSYTHITVVGEP